MGSAGAPTPAMPSSQNAARYHRRSINSLEGQTGSLQTSKGTIHGNIGLRDRIHHFTFAEFTCTMSTGGVALLLAQTPHRFNGLEVLGTIVYILDITLFITFCICIGTRFYLWPQAFKASLQHPTESLFIPTVFISILNILSNMQEYGVPHTGPWLIVALRVLFWIYSAVTFIVAVAQYFFLFTGEPLTLQNMTPAWILPVFPIMLSGTLASLIGHDQPHEHALPILVAGITFQGLGMLIATFMYGPYLARLMTSGLPEPNMRPGMFIAVGPPSFTGLALLGISQNLGSIYPEYGTITGVRDPVNIPDIFRILAISSAVFLWGTAFWFFCITFVSVMHGAFWKPKSDKASKARGMSFHLVWWAFVFPNIGFAICTIQIGKAFMSEGVLWVGSAMTIVLVAVWLFVGIMHIRAIWIKQIMWPGKDEDHDQ